MNDYHDPRNRPTLVECPWCAGQGMVTHEKRAEWLLEYPELAANDTEEDDPPPDAA
jgi:hypothetical protein